MTTYRTNGATPGMRIGDRKKQRSKKLSNQSTSLSVPTRAIQKRPLKNEFTYGSKSSTRGSKRSTKRSPQPLTVRPETSKRMAAVRQYGTGPEQIVRKAVRELGMSYRCGVSSLPGSPDIANARHR